MQTVNVLVIQPLSDAALAHIAALDPRIDLVDGRGLFECEYAAT